MEEGKDLWEGMKVWGVNRLADATKDAIHTHLAMRNMLPAETAERNRTAMTLNDDVLAYYDQEIRFITSAQYPRHIARSARYLFACQECGRAFLCNIRGEGGDRKRHEHQQFSSRCVYTLSDMTAELLALAEQGRLSRGLVEFWPVRQIPGVDEVLKASSGFGAVETTILSCL
ncbi:hypothetical protein HDU86_005288 [Geranomyces michiganensis]|nr:hypothetical protein HDU86_005288 [Geranomyces michiganensis]